MALPRCEKHNRPIFKGQTECFLCQKETARSTVAGRDADRELSERFRRIVDEVVPFGEKLKKRMQSLGKNHVRIICPNKSHTETKYITARILGRRDHLHFACEDSHCHYRMME